MSMYLCVPREWHVDAVFHVFSYLELYHNMRVVSDPVYPSVDMGAFIKTDWKSICGDANKLVPSDAPVPHGK
jgi:hypothetical protein